jgi:N-acetylglucosamine-6-sulfatase
VGFAPAQEEANAQSSTTEQPNIVFVLTDDLDYASAQKMPEISALLAEQGTSFEEAFVSHSVCCPSRATILTGLYDHNHNVLSNRPPDGGFEKFVSEGHEENTIGVGLQEAGYQTAFFGKYLNGYQRERRGADPTHVPPGWDEWYGKLDGQDLYDYRINENGEEVSYGSEEEDFYTDVLAGQTTDFVRRAAPDSEPFFMYVAPTAPHGPATPAERHEGAFSEEEPYRPLSYNEEDVSDKPSQIQETERISEEEASTIDDYYRQRLESMLAVDEMVGSLLEELEATGELENTYIFFTSDNGFEQGEHRLQKGKSQAYEESSRVPLLVRGPGVPAGVKTEKLAVNTDFAPTFADLAGAAFPADGRSLVPVLAGSQDPSWRTSILLERLPSQRGYQAIRTETHKYVEYNNGDVELYDLTADPYEMESIHESADPALLEDLKARLEALRSCSEEGCREAEDAP